MSLRLYSDLASWWPLFSPPSDYTEEAADLLPFLRSGESGPEPTLLELGCGGGSFASHLQPHFRLTLTDVSQEMLAVSRTVNPDSEHIESDMRTLDLGRRFDVVLIHDAVMYMTTRESLRAALATASRHCRAGGVLAVLPDYVSETFQPSVDTDGHDAPDGRGLRCLSWTWDPVADDEQFTSAYALLLREADGRVTADHEVHTEGLFPRAVWTQLIDDVGFDVRSRVDPWEREVFIGRRRRGAP